MRINDGHALLALRIRSAPHGADAALAVHLRAELVRTPVAELMTSDVVCVTADVPIGGLAALRRARASTGEHSVRPRTSGPAT
jgi:hypothetical protein